MALPSFMSCQLNENVLSEMLIEKVNNQTNQFKSYTHTHTQLISLSNNEEVFQSGNLNRFIIKT